MDVHSRSPDCGCHSAGNPPTARGNAAWAGVSGTIDPASGAGDRIDAGGEEGTTAD
jgi:hypothetical protein